jgi:triosephosphate isomerase
MRRALIAGNWKMHKTAAEGVSLATALRSALDERPAPADVLVAPPFTALHAVGAALSGSGILLGAQNMHFEKEGAFTGEISAPMLREAGCTHVIVGHSERRHLFHEDDGLVAQKVASAIEGDLVPILCVGETLAERRASRTEEVVLRQLDLALFGVEPGAVSSLVVAYEPVWAIGSGHPATPAQAQEVHALIRRRIASSHGAPAADGVRILYGGSVKPENIVAIVAEPDIDGALVGGACLDASSFLRILHAH